MAKHCDNNKGEDKPKVKFFILEIQTEIEISDVFFLKHEKFYKF